MQLMGVYDAKLVEPLARVLANLGLKRGMVVYGNGIDEATVTGPTTICEFNNGELKSYTITPEEVGLNRCELKDLVGGVAEENAEITRNILNGKDRGPKRDAVLLNAGLSLYIGGKAAAITEGVQMAAQLIDSGKAKAKLDEFVALTNQ